MIDCKTIEFPIDQNHKIGSDKGNSSMNKANIKDLLGSSFT